MRKSQMNKALLSLTLTVFCFQGILIAGDEIKLKAGMVIKTNSVVKPGTYKLNLKEKDENTGIITIEGDNITVEFRGAEIVGSSDSPTPDLYEGIGIVVKGKNVSVKNVIIRGYKTAIYAENSDNLEIYDCNLSYNYRPLLKSNETKEDKADMLYFQNNEADEWKKYGAGIYLKNCQRSKIRGNTVSNGQNGLLLSNSNDGKIWNNNFTYNSGVGIGLYRSSKNKILHNKLDYNVRGFSYGFYESGHDAAAILLFEQSNENLIGYNSCTHSGDGLLLWAGKSTMESGEGGCNDNVIYGNDFSYAVSNGIEATYSRNVISNNTINECKNGIWAGFSFNSQIIGNTIKGNEVGIAIEHGQGNTVAYNKIDNCEKGIYLWERAEKPTDNFYVSNKDVSSRDNTIKNNILNNSKIALEINGGKNTALNGNDISRAEQVLASDGKSVNLVFRKNNIKTVVAGNTNVIHGSQKANENFFDTPIDGFAAASEAFDSKLDKVYIESYAPEKFKDGNDALAPPVVAKGAKPQPKGRPYIVMTPYGPYNFTYPSLSLTDRGKTGNFTFEILGPKGSWKVVSSSGIVAPRIKAGAAPGAIKLSGSKEEPKEAKLVVSYTGAIFTDALGNEVKTDKNPYQMEWNLKLP